MRGLIFGVLLLVFIFATWMSASEKPAHAASAYKTDYELVSGSATITLGGVGGKGDVLERLIIVPETTGAGTVAIKDGSNTAINVFVTGTLSDLHPIVIDIGARSTSGAWQVITGANVHAIGVGSFK